MENFESLKLPTAINRFFALSIEIAHDIENQEFNTEEAVARRKERSELLDQINKTNFRNRALRKEKNAVAGSYQ